MAELIDVIAEMRGAANREVNPERRAAMFTQLEEITDAAIRIANKQVGAHLAELSEATDKLEKGVAELKKAQKELGDVAKQIKAVASLVDGFVRVAGLIAG